MPDTSLIYALAAAPFVGSFLGLLIARLPAGHGFVIGRSRCDHCGRALRARELIPIVSWIAARGRCRHCGERIALFHPIIEVTAFAVALWAATAVSGWLLWASCVLGWVLLALAAIDFRHLILPDVLTLPLIPVGLATAYSIDPALLPGHTIGAAAGYASFAAAGVLYKLVRRREGLGLGDAKLMAAAGAWLSWHGLPSVVLVAASVGLAAAGARSLFGHGISLSDRLPFGPCICLATWVVWLYGPFTAA